MTTAPQKTPSASVILPTYNRLPALQEVVDAVLRQIGEMSGSCELIVVDDGSTDGTGAWLEERAGELGITVIRQANAGPAVARNRGARASRADIVLFLGDDTVPEPGWLREHLEAHRLGAGRGLAVLGYTSFPAEWDSPFLRWINEHGAQFGYALIDHPTDVPFNFFYTSNVSLPRAVFEEHGGFREDFPAAAWEDIEFAYRAVGHGLRLCYVPRARTIHHHRIDVASFCRRQRTSGRSAAIFARLHPELEAFLGVPCSGGHGFRLRWERAALRAWIGLAELLPGLATGAVYRRLLDSHYLEGLTEGLQEPGSHDG
jgi:GT2 family glycosyltransferase